MFDFSLFAALICVYLVWVVNRLDKKITSIGQLSTMVLTQVSAFYTAEDYPEEVLEKATNDWENWDKE